MQNHNSISNAKNNSLSNTKSPRETAGDLLYRYLLNLCTDIYSTYVPRLIYPIHRNSFILCTEINLSETLYH